MLETEQWSAYILTDVKHLTKFQMILARFIVPSGNVV